MNRYVPHIVVSMIALTVGLCVGWMFASHVNQTRLDRIVAMSWGDGKYGPAFYGAQVYLEPIMTGYAVKAVVWIGRENGYFHDCGTIATAQTDVEAVANWGTIEWRPDGLHIGNGVKPYFLPRARFENHR